MLGAAIPDDAASDAAKKKNQPKPSGQLFLAIIVTVCYFGVLVLAMFQPIPDKNHDIVITMLTVSGAVLTATWAFYFGSSISSQRKDNTIEQMSTGPTVTETTVQGTGDNLTTKTTTTQPAGGTAPLAVNVQPPATVTVSAPAAEVPAGGAA